MPPAIARRPWGTRSRIRLGIIGPILCIFVFSRLVRPRLAAPPVPPAAVEVVLAAEKAGTTLGEVIAGLPPGVHVVAVRHGRINKLPEPQIRLDAGDVLLLFGEAAALELRPTSSSVASRPGVSRAIAARWTSRDSSSREPR